MDSFIIGAKNLCLGENLSELSQSNEHLVRISSLHCKYNAKLRLNYIICPKRNTKKQFFQLKNRLRNI